MTDRTTETTVTFRRPFTLTGFEAAEPAGTYRLVTDEVEIPGLSFLAYAHQATMIHVPALSSGRPTRQVFPVDRAELDRAMAADAVD